MRSQQANPSARDWFRVENAFVDSENADNETTPVYIYDSIGESWFGDTTSASEFVKQIGAIKTRNIELHLNSPGGDIFDGVAIYNALKAHPARVTVIVDALAASAASFIAQAGDEVIMTKAATMMIHDGSALAWGPAEVMRQTADLLDKLSNTVAGIYSDRAGQSVAFWRDLMIEEVWYNSQEAVDAGLADKIGEDTKVEDDTAAQNKWDLSIYNHAGRSAAPNPFGIRQRIANRLKENLVTQAASENTPEDPKEDEVNPASPEVNPETQSTEGGTAEEVQKERNDNPGTVQSPPGSAGNSTTGTFTFTVAGSQTTDFQAVQNRLTMLETFRTETLKQAKVDFVNKLATDNKIIAPQIDAMLNYANSLDDAGYEAWKATWDGAAALPLLGSGHGGGGTSNHAGSGTQAANDELEIARETVMHHKAGGVTPEKIMQMDSYKKLMALDPNFKL